MPNSTELRTGPLSLEYIAAPSPGKTASSSSTLKAIIHQICRFGFVGVLNASIDLLAFNILLWLLPTQNNYLLVLYSICAYSIGAINSYLLNKWWTFRKRKETTKGELLRFVVVNIMGISCNSILVWCFMQMLPASMTGTFLYANIAKASALICSALISFAGMRWWVFASSASRKEKKHTTMNLTFDEQPLRYSLSVILPAHNEEAIIATTVKSVVEKLTTWTNDFEVIVVNDGSRDRTKEIVKELIATDDHIRLIDHEVNRGYGAALVSGFTAVTKDLAFFMDADGQFDIQDLTAFFPLIEEYDAVLGYRIKRQDTWIRKLNAWGWKMLTRAVFGLQVRDVDCAFKLYRAEFFHTYQLETGGAMINTEILYKWKRAQYTYTQVGVHHLPRRSGRATGAKLSVIIRALKELMFYARKWHREELALLAQKKDGVDVASDDVVSVWNELIVSDRKGTRLDGTMGR